MVILRVVSPNMVKTAVKRRPQEIGKGRSNVTSAVSCLN